MSEEEAKSKEEISTEKTDDSEETVLFREEDELEEEEEEEEEISLETPDAEEVVTTAIKKTKFSMKFKMTILTALLVAVMTLAISFYLLNNIKTNLLEAMKLTAQLFTMNLSQGLTELFDDDTSRHDIVVKNKQTLKDIEKIVVINRQMELIDSTDEKIFQKVLMSKFDTSIKKTYLELDQEIIDFLKENPYYEKTYKEKGEDKISFIAPVKFINTVLGYIKIDLTLKYIAKKIQEVQIRVIIFVSIALIIGIIFSYLLSAHIIKPINTLYKGAQIIGAGNLKHKIKIHTNDELEQLAEEFNNMTRRLLKARKSIIEKERMDEQIEIAKTIQENLLIEEFPELDELEFSAFYKAAKGIGGDYYDIIYQKDTHKIGIIMADVSGKGVAAALVMVMIRTILQSTFRFLTTADEIIDNINKGITQKLTGDKFVTMFYFNYDINTGKMEYSNAAHSPLIVYRAQLNTLVEFDTDGAPVGIDPDFTFGVNTTYLQEGDILITFTDGISEAMNENSELFRTSRIKEIIKNNFRLSAEQLKDKIMDTVNEFVGSAPQHDDMALVIVKIKKINNPGSKKIAGDKKDIDKIRKEAINPLDPRSIII